VTVQSLYLVIGGRLQEISKPDFADPEGAEIVGVFPSRQKALAAWRAKSLRSVDDALMRYFVLPLHELLPKA
jgi:hypothetical protein